MTQVKISGIPAEQVQVTMRRMERREWWLWSNTVFVTILLLLAVGSFALPALLTDADRFHTLSLNQTVMGLTGLVLLFNIYLIYQQVLINRIRRQLTDQIFAVDKVETLAQEVYKVAVLDSLTGLFNRRYIERRLEEEIARARRSGCPVTVILFDLDGFKQINDKYGHAVGDDLLRAFAERLSKTTRGSDVASRYGGDEFLALLPECKPEDVQHILRRLDGFCVRVGNEEQPVAYSAGWTNYIAGESAEELLKRADAALYANKRRGSQPIEVACQ